MSEPLTTHYKGRDPMDSHGRRKKSRIIPPDLRKKVAQACDMCKRRKQKCTGLQPCVVCDVKGFTCEYTAIDRRVLKGSKKAELSGSGVVASISPSGSSGEPNKQTSASTKNTPPSDSSNPFSGTMPKARIPESLQPLLSFSMNVTDAQDDAVVALGTDQSWRLLFDDCGNLRFLGESCGISYLLQCRKLFSKVLGPQEFSDDSERLRYTDSTAIPITGVMAVLPPKEYTNYLVRTYSNNVNQVLYIQDDMELLRLVDKAYESQQPRELCILTMILAIGSVFAKAELMTNLFPFPEHVFVEPDVFFQWSMAILNTTFEDGNLWLVEIHLLMFFFYHFTGHRHIAWIKLGVAIRHAQGMGLHRRFVNESFNDLALVLHRRRIFRSLFIMDSMSSVHLGRSMTIRDQDWDDMKSLDYLDDYQNELLHVCHLNSKIILGIYFNPAVTIKGALKLAVEMKVYSLKHPLKAMSMNASSSPVDHKILLPHVIYLHGIVLLSRSFFHFIVLKKLGLVSYTPDPRRLSHLNSFYHSCIKASLLVVKTVEYCYYQNIHPFKPMSLVSCTFHAGMVLGLLLLLRSKGIDHEMFKDDPNIEVDADSMLSSAMTSVIKVLVHCGRIDAQSARYSVILQNMFDATKVKPQTVSTAASENNRESFEKILRFQDWLFPKVESLPGGSSEVSTTSGYDSGPQQDDFLKDLAGMGNVESSGQFLDDLLYTVIDGQPVNQQPEYRQ